MGKYINFLKDTDLFFDLTKEQLEMVESLCDERIYKKGELVFSENTREAELYLVMDGLVEILVNPNLVSSKPEKGSQPSVIAILRRGQSFGEIALVDEGIRSASATAGEDRTRLLRIRRDQFLSLCNSNPELGYRVMYNLSMDLAQKIRNADLQIREALLYQKGKSS